MTPFFPCKISDGIFEYLDETGQRYRRIDSPYQDLTLLLKEISNELGTSFLLVASSKLSRNKRNVEYIKDAHEQLIAEDDV